jgi:xylose isomerase
MDNLARALLIADKMLTDGKLQAFVDERYAGLERAARQGHPGGQAVARRPVRAALADKLDPKPRSGRQEMLETIVNRYL